MRSSLALALFASIATLSATASAQFCSQPVRPLSGQASTDGFGSTVELGSSWAHISDVAPASAAVPGAGRLNLYTRAPIAGSINGGHLVFNAQLEASNSQPRDGFGLTSDRSGGTIVVGAPNHTGAGIASGAVYLFEEVGGQWTEILDVALPVLAGGGDEFGKHVSIEGDWMAIAAPGRNNVYLYQRMGGVWFLHQTVRPANSMHAGLVAVELEGSTLAVCGRNVGAVFELDAAGQTWNQTLPFATGQNFAFTGMDLTTDSLVIARNNGLVEVYERNPQTGGWSPSLFSLAQPSSVARVGDRVLVASGAPAGGSVAIFSRMGGSSWSMEGSIPEVLDHPDSLATDGQSVLVARPVNGFMSAPTLYDLDCENIGVSSCTQLQPNSTGFTGRIYAVGSDVVANNDVTLLASVLPQDAFGLFLVSRTPAFSPGIPGPLCISGSIGRYIGPGEVQSTGAAGTLQLPIDLTAMPSPTGFQVAAAGDSWYFQVWHRDDPAIGGYAFTDAVHIILR